MIPSDAIARHKTAIRRNDFSRPVKCLFRDGLIGKSLSLFDYGCGRGEDVEFLSKEGIPCTGWDPVYRPDAAHSSADVVTLSYVLNVIENPSERVDTLQRAWSLCRRLLVVAAQVQVGAGSSKSQVAFGDGILTGRNTFQKFYQQDELKAFLETQLATEAVPAALGIFYLFRSESDSQQFLASRFRRAVPPCSRPRKPTEDEEGRRLLEPFTEVLLGLGRLPEEEEYPEATALVSAFGSLRRAFARAQRLLGADAWTGARQRRTEDLLVFLALARFRRRPPLSNLPVNLQRDIRGFFGSYTRACQQADELLFRAGNAEAIDAACRAAPVGKKLPDDLYVHRSALDFLDPLLRVYEGCGRAYLGDVEGANLIKIHRHSGKLSYLIYPGFDTDPHPALLRCVRLSLRTRQVDCHDYAGRANPPILHRKETFLHPDHPLHARFARLTRQEERHGLLDAAASIGTRDGWQTRLTAAGFRLRGHQLLHAAAPGKDGGPAPGPGLSP